MNKNKNLVSSPQEKQALFDILEGGNPAVEEVQVGTSKTVSTVNPPQDMEVGDTWEDEDGRIWEQKEGYKVRTGKLNSHNGVPMFCPECDRVMNHRNHEKTYFIFGHCHDCQMDFETKLRARGEYEKWHKARTLENMKDWVEDQKRQFDEYKKSTKNEFMKNEYGDIETWEGGPTMDKLQEEFDEFISVYEKEIEKLENELVILNQDNEVNAKEP